jgi:hypothetical protein
MLGRREIHQERHDRIPTDLTQHVTLKIAQSRSFGTLQLGTHTNRSHWLPVVARHTSLS